MALWTNDECSIADDEIKDGQPTAQCSAVLGHDEAARFRYCDHHKRRMWRTSLAMRKIIDRADFALALARDAEERIGYPACRAESNLIRRWQHVDLAGHLAPAPRCT
jgi:hypothetical protein